MRVADMKVGIREDWQTGRLSDRKASRLGVRESGGWKQENVYRRATGTFLLSRALSSLPQFPRPAVPEEFCSDADPIHRRVTPASPP
jgi:hypothetical protein